MTQIIAGIDVHKRVLMVAVGVVTTRESAQGDTEQRTEFEMRRFGTTWSELLHLSAWLGERRVQQVVMESTAQYWKPVWLALEPHFHLNLAQAWSNRAPKGKKTDYKDAQRLVRRHLAGELTMSLVPDPEQRQMRTVTRRRTQLMRERIRLQNHVEALLEEARIKLSSVVTDLLGASGRRILTAMSKGETDAARLAELGDDRLKCGREQLRDALTGSLTALQQSVLKQYLDQLSLIDTQAEELSKLAGELTRPYQDAITRLAQIPGIGVITAQMIIAEAGPRTEAFPSPGQFSSWVGACPGKHESAGENQSSRCAKGNRYLRGGLCQAAQAAVKTKNSIFQQKFRRLLPRLGYAKAIWAIVRHLCVVIWLVLHKGVAYEEKGQPTTPGAAKRRAQRLIKQLRLLGYDAHVTPLTEAALAF
jgi:transposase